MEDDDDFEAITLKLKPHVTPQAVQKEDISGSFPFACQCGCVFQYRCSLRKHCAKCKGVTTGKRKCYIPGCSKLFNRETEVILHLEKDHGQVINKSSIQFNSFQEFLQWKEKEQDTKLVFFAQRRGCRVSEQSKYYYFVCQHDGSAKSHQKHGRKTSRKNKKGQVKQGLTCPARLLVKQDRKSEVVSVQNIGSHSHKLEFENTKFQPMSRSIKENIKHRLALGVSAKKVRESLRGDAGLRGKRDEDSDLRREYFIPIRNVREIERKMKVSQQLHSDDAMSLMLLIQKLQSEENDPVLLYKPQGGKVVVGPDEMESLPEFNNLFLLGIQTREQRACLQTFANKIVCVDATHCTNQYGFQLLNLVVPDEFGKGYPVGHFIATRMDEQVLRYFFLAIKNICPELVINAVMTDDDYAPWNAIVSVFGGSIKHLLCTWHILRAWSRKLRNLVSDKVMYQDMFTALRSIMYCVHESDFVKLLEAFYEKYRLSAGEFLEYFTSNYIKRPEVWALCYRGFPHGNANTNMLVESFHNRLKTFYMERIPNKRLDVLVHLLLEIERDDFMRRRKSIVFKESKTGNTFNTQSRHERGMLIPDSDVQQIENDEGECLKETGLWHVKSQSKSTVVYIVKLTSVFCALDFCMEACVHDSCCGLCSHMYFCSCMDMSGMCKHVHKVQSIAVRLSDSKWYVHDRDDPFKMYDTPCATVCPTEVNTGKLIDKLKEKISKLVGYLDTDNVKQLLLPHIDGVISNLIQQCEAVVDKNAQPTAKMDQVTSIAPNEKLQKQIKPQSMRRVSRKTGSTMLPKLDFEEKQRVLGELNQQPKATSDNSMSDVIDADNFTINIDLSNVHKASDWRNTRINHGKLSLRGKLSTQISLKDSRSITIPIAYESQDLSETILSLGGETNLSMPHLKSLEYYLPMNVESYLKQGDKQFKTGWVYDRIIDAFLFRLSELHPNTLYAETVVTLALKNGSVLDRLWLGEDLSCKSVVFFPCNLTGNHWVLFVADVLHKTITFLNPTGEDPSADECQIFTLIGELMCNKFHISVHKWNWYTPAHTQQLDSYNCGVFIMWYALQIASVQPLTDRFDPNVFREFVFQLLAGNCMKRPTFSDNSCGLCKSQVLPGDYVECSKCRQSFHCHCLGMPLESAQNINLKFVCP